jgi:hypothetical protein
MDARDPVFVVGFHRSGTTLLRLLLNAHSRIAIPPESHFVVQLYRRYDGVYPGHAAFLADLFQHPRFEEWRLDRFEVAASLAGVEPAWGTAFTALYSRYAAQRGKSRWGDKTPMYARSLGLLSGIFPRIRVVHLVRDGRDVWCSLRGLSWWSAGLYDTAVQWRETVEAARRCRDRCAYLEVRYRDLVADTQQTLREICEFVGEDFEASMLDFHRSASEEMPPDRMGWHRQVAKPISEERVGRWKEELSSAEAALFWRCADGTLSSIGAEAGNGGGIRTALHYWKERGKASIQLRIRARQRAGSTPAIRTG